jgi:hypothetical protein
VQDLSPGDADDAIASGGQSLIATAVTLKRLPGAVAGVSVGLHDHALSPP